MMRQATYRRPEAEQFMRDFYKDVSEKKTVARGARYRKGGSKSKKCSMSTDYMTQKQWKERNGPVMSYAMNQPIEWESFKKMPVDLQKAYVEGLDAKYNVNFASLSELFGVSKVTLKKTFDKNGLDFGFGTGKRMSAEQKKVWHEFIGLEEDSQADEEPEQPLFEAVEEVPEEVFPETVMSGLLPGEVIPKQSDDNPDPVTKCIMSDFSVNFSGRIDVDMIANSLRTILGSDSFGSLKIVYTAESSVES